MASKARYAEHQGDPFLVQASPNFLESVPDEDTPETLYEKAETVLKEELGRMLSLLPAKESQAIQLWLSGMTQAQIAEQDGVTQAAISIRAKRGLEKLFDMRDRGELGTLKFIWDGLHKIRKHIDTEIDMERAADSDTSLPLGEEIGEELGERIKLLEVQPLPQAVEEKQRTAPKKKTIRKGDKNALNERESAILRCLSDATHPLHLTDIEVITKPQVDVSDYSERNRNSWVRNSLRKLVRTNLIQKLGKGRYAPCPK